MASPNSRRPAAAKSKESKRDEKLMATAKSQGTLSTADPVLSGHSRRRLNASRFKLVGVLSEHDGSYRGAGCEHEITLSDLSESRVRSIAFGEMRARLRTIADAARALDVLVFPGGDVRLVNILDGLEDALAHVEGDDWEADTRDDLSKKIDLQRAARRTLMDIERLAKMFVDVSGGHVRSPGIDGHITNTSNKLSGAKGNLLAILACAVRRWTTDEERVNALVAHGKGRVREPSVRGALAKARSRRGKPPTAAELVAAHRVTVAALSPRAKKPPPKQTLKSRSPKARARLIAATTVDAFRRETALHRSLGFHADSLGADSFRDVTAIVALLMHKGLANDEHIGRYAAHALGCGWKASRDFFSGAILDRHGDVVSALILRRHKLV